MSVLIGVSQYIFIVCTLNTVQDLGWQKRQEMKPPKSLLTLGILKLWPWFYIETKRQQTIRYAGQDKARRFED